MLYPERGCGGDRRSCLGSGPWLAIEIEHCSCSRQSHRGQLKGLIGLIKQCVTGQQRGALRRGTKWQVFIEGGFGKDGIGKRKIVLGQAFCPRGKGKGSSYADDLISLRGGWRAHVANSLT